MPTQTVEFTVLFPAAPEVFLLMLGIFALLLIYWAAKWVVSIYTGSGGS